MRSLNTIFKAALKRIVPELKERDDFQVQAFKIQCSECGNEQNYGYRYLIDNTSDWIEVEQNSHICRWCRDKNFLDSYQPESLKTLSAEIQQRLCKEYFMIPDDLQKAGFKNYYDTNEITKAAKKEAMLYTKSFIKNPDERYNLLLMGNPGTGKSHLCATIGRTLKGHGFTVAFITTGSLLSKIKATYNKGAGKSEEDIINDVKKFDLFILDDLGSEAKGKDDWSKKTLFEIVNSRIGKPTIYSSNLNDKTLPDAIGERVFSRLYNNTKFIDMFTDDYRKTLRVK